MRKDNEGFSLVELIIVIAIMAILVGIVGSRVVPYIEKSKESKDQQVLSGWVTAATSSYAMNAVDLTDASYDIEIDSTSVTVNGTNASILKNDFNDFSNIDVSAPFSDFSSKLYKEITKVTFTVTTEITGSRHTVCICDIEGVTSGTIATSELVTK